MKNVMILLLLAVCITFMSCASTSHGFKEPTTDATMLIIGHVIIEDDYYTDQVGVYTANIEVAVNGKTTAGKELGLWVKADENGFFALADVPMGEYAIKGIRSIIGRGSAVTIVNSLRRSTDPYRVTNSEQPITFNALYYPFEPVGRIASLQHNVFKLDQMSSQTGQVNTLQQFSIKDYKLSNGEILNFGPVEDYFIEKYPASAWKPMLEESRGTIRFQR